MISRPVMLRCVVAGPGQITEFHSLTDEEIASARSAGKIVIVDPDDDVESAPPIWEDDASKWIRLNERIRRRTRW